MSEFDRAQAGTVIYLQNLCPSPLHYTVESEAWTFALGFSRALRQAHAALLSEAHNVFVAAGSHRYDYWSMPVLENEFWVVRWGGYSAPFVDLKPRVTFEGITLELSHSRGGFTQYVRG